MAAVRIWIVALAVAALAAPPAALVSGARPGQPPHLAQAPPAKPRALPCPAGRQKAGVSRWTLASGSTGIGPLAAAAAACGRPPARRLASAAAAARHCNKCMRALQLVPHTRFLFWQAMLLLLATNTAHSSSLS